MQVYNDEQLYHFGKLGMKWGKRTTSKPTNFYNIERSKDQKSNSLEKDHLKNKYYNNKISTNDYVKQYSELGQAHVLKSLANAKKAAFSSMSEKEQKKFTKNTTSGKQQADMILTKIARGEKASLLDKVSLYGYK